MVGESDSGSDNDDDKVKIVEKDGRRYYVVELDDDEGQMYLPVEDEGGGGSSSAASAPLSPTEQNVETIVEALGGPQHCSYPRWQIRKALLARIQGETIDDVIVSLMEAGPRSEAEDPSMNRRRGRTKQMSRRSTFGNSSAGPRQIAPSPARAPKPKEPAPPPIPRELIALMEGSEIHPRNESDASILEQIENAGGGGGAGTSTKEETDETMGEAAEEDAEAEPVEDKPAAAAAATRTKDQQHRAGGRWAKKRAAPTTDDTDSVDTESKGRAVKRKRRVAADEDDDEEDESSEKAEAATTQKAKSASTSTANRSTRSARLKEKEKAASNDTREGSHAPDGVHHADEEEVDATGIHVELAKVNETERIHIGDLRIEVDRVHDKVANELDRKSAYGNAYGGLELWIEGSAEGVYDLVGNEFSGRQDLDISEDDARQIPNAVSGGWTARRKRKANDSTPKYLARLDQYKTFNAVTLPIADATDTVADLLVPLIRQGWIVVRPLIAKTSVLVERDAEMASKAQKSKDKGKQKVNGASVAAGGAAATTGSNAPLPPMISKGPEDDDVRMAEDENAVELPYTVVFSLFLTQKALRYGTTRETALDSFVEGKQHSLDKTLFMIVSALAELNGSSGKDTNAEPLLVFSCETARLTNRVGKKSFLPKQIGRQYLKSFLTVDPQTDMFYTSTRTFHNPDGNSSVFSREETNELGLDLDGLLEYVRPAVDAPEEPAPPGLLPKLFPFQRKALYWMLQKELDTRQDGAHVLHPLWWALKPTGTGSLGRTIYLNEITGTLSLKRFSAMKTEPGGCLAEEMGLGKTVELLALILRHPRDFSAPDPSRSRILMDRIPNEYERPLEVKSTLIVAPQAITPQWIEETLKHTPGLRCRLYEVEDGWWNNKEHGILGSERKRVAEMFGNYDVVFTTYETLQAELRRSGRNKKSPLLWVQWWRVVLDEAQMVADSNATAARMAGELWRVNGWTCTGTPISNALNDIHGLLAFLDSDPFASKEVIKHAVMEPFLRRVPSGIQRLRGLLSKFLWRNTREHVKDEMSAPQCTEERIELDFVQAERLFYNKMHSDAREFLKAQFNLNQATLSMTSAVMSRMTALRQCCDHPQLTGQYNATSGKNWEQLKKSTLSYEDIMGEILRKAESELEGLEYDYVNEILLVGYATLIREMQESDEEGFNEDMEPPPKYSRKQLEEFYLNCLQVIDRNLELVAKLDPTTRLMVEYFGSAKQALRKWLRATFHTVAAIKALDEQHPLLEAMDASDLSEYISDLLLETDFTRDEVEKRYWLNTYKQVAVVRNEEEGLRRKRVNEVTRVQRRPLQVIEKSMETLGSKVRSKQAEVNHVKSRVDFEKSRRKRKEGAPGEAKDEEPQAGPSGIAGPSRATPENEGPAPSTSLANADSIICSICFEEVEEPTVTPCAHEFCLQCIKDVLEVSPHCPLCRAHLSIKDLKVAKPKVEKDAEVEPEMEIKGEFGSKITRIITDVQSRLARDKDFKAVVFSHWKPMLKLLAKAFAFNNISAVDFSGDKETRANALHRIKTDPDCKIILVSMRAKDGAAGLTLTCCNVAYLVEPAIYPGVCDQATGRINRIGQTRATTIVHLGVKDTIEPKIEAIQAKKRAATRKGAASHAVPNASTNEMAVVSPSMKIKLSGANNESDDLQTDEVCFVFDLDLDEMKRDYERQQQAIAQVHAHAARIRRRNREGGSQTADSDEDDEEEEAVPTDEED